jgi:MFS transporter, ACS family, glucarate transporter
VRNLKKEGDIMNAAIVRTKTTTMRWKLALIMFLIGFVSYMDRVNLSVATPEIMKEFGFSKIEMGWMQTVFFIGYSIVQVPGGIMAEYFGHRRIVTLAVSWWSAFTAFTAAGFNLTSFLIIRGIFGVGEGPIFPAFSNFIFRWFNKNERAKASSLMLAGVFLGPVVGPVVTVALMVALGWRWVFIIFGATGFIFALLWYVFATQTPGESKYVNEAELSKITGDEKIVSGKAGEKKVELAPWRKFMGNMQFWAIGIQYFITDYIMYVFLAWLPLYLMEVHKFSLKSMGIAASFPWLALCITTLTTGYIADKMVKAGLSKHRARTLFGSFGLIACCVTLYMASITAVPSQNVVWLTLSLGSLGFTFTASWASCLDIGGKYSGSVSGWMNLWGNLGGIVAPVGTAWVATKYGWQAAIAVTAISAVIGVIAWFLVKPDKSIVLGEER